MQIGELVGGTAIVCGPDTSVAEAAGVMIEQRIGSLGVMEGTRLAGIFTERDVVRAAAAGADLSVTSVTAYMTPDPDSLTPDIDAAAAAEWLLATGYRHLPVLDDDRLLGIASIKDVLWAITEPLEREGST